MLGIGASLGGGPAAVLEKSNRILPGDVCSEAPPAEGNAGGEALGTRAAPHRLCLLPLGAHTVGKGVEVARNPETPGSGWESLGQGGLGPEQPLGHPVRLFRAQTLATRGSARPGPRPESWLSLPLCGGPGCPAPHFPLLENGYNQYPLPCTRRPAFWKNGKH